MALTTTKLSGTITAGQTQITLAAFTNPSTGQISPKTMLQFATGEKVLVNNSDLSPTISVTRGYEGTVAAAHTVNEGVKYGLMSDASWTEADTYVGQHNVKVPSEVRFNAVEVTATGVTGTDSATLTSAPFLIVNSTGATDAGINLWVPTVGDAVVIHNDSTTGAVKFYSIGATINGVTGTTGVSITVTGTKGAMLACATAGAWRIVIGAT